MQMPYIGKSISPIAVVPKLFGPRIPFAVKYFSRSPWRLANTKDNYEYKVRAGKNWKT